MAKKDDFFLDILKKATPQVITNSKLDIIILEELHALISPLTSEEYSKLETSILKEGCRESLIIWKKENEFILVDGHNRYSICKRHNILFNTQIKEFSSIEEVKDWMINNQLGKRNLTEEVKSYLRGLQYKTEKKITPNIQNLRQNTEGDKLSPSVKTKDKLAEQHKVSAKTIQRDAQFFEGLELLSKYDSSLKWKILNKEIIVAKNIIVDFPNKTEKEMRDIIDKLNKGLVLKTTTTPLPFDDRKKEITHLLTLFFKNYDKDILQKIKILIEDLEKETK